MIYVPPWCRGDTGGKAVITEEEHETIYQRYKAQKRNNVCELKGVKCELSKAKDCNRLMIFVRQYCLKCKFGLELRE